VRRQLEYIGAVRRFAVDSLGLRDTRNYTTYYDQQGKPLLWVLTASEAFRIKPYLWSFPVVGNVSYKGFFQKTAGEHEAHLLEESGYDIDYGEVGAWSTLGWFRDPILSGMLRRGEGRLAELIIHEMTHATLYVPGQVDFNENLASFIGEQGARRFLRSHFGEEATETVRYRDFLHDYNALARHLVRGTHWLDSIYQTREFYKWGIAEKQLMKRDLIDSVLHALDTVIFQDTLRARLRFRGVRPNNAYFLNYLRYDAMKDSLDRVFRDQFDGDFSRFLRYQRDRYSVK
jgi:predicted aminopeptidase